ncbi:uncharacterized protein LOC111481774 [Cucurbita maxima]|uniref:Uncharacterized protein LOC111481774 n=1 Tax=Cucurbita maxima TaxID=3661 RepID=A0A6J1J6W6_CUCMA|nr:uncharacterized protein LOC111481774 [Cucurbita maxima]
MDGGLNKIVPVLIALFLLTFLLLVAQILYLLSRRRHQHCAAEPNKKCFYSFCWRNQSRIQPKEIASISKTHHNFEAAAVVVEEWQELGGPSRTLFTIQEEEESEGTESSSTMTFHTPCGSPANYFTPSPSPTREAGNFPVDGDCWDHNRTTPFLALEISSH